MNYINQNSQSDKYAADCQLVSALNMYRYLTGDVWYSQESKQYQSLAEECGCVHGSCINIGKAYKKFGIKEVKRYEHFLDLEFGLLSQELPIEASVWHSKYGFHCCTIVGSLMDTQENLVAVKVTNFYYETDPNLWMLFDDFRYFLTQNPDKSEPRYVARSFKLK